MTAAICPRTRVGRNDRCGHAVRAIGIPRGTRPPLRSTTPARCRPKR
jgi:hypothetical protein